MASMLRQGLPRTGGGQPWPPSDVRIAFEIPIPDDREARPTHGVAPASPHPTASVGNLGAPTARPAAATLRRGLPRRSGGEPWPPADLTLPSVAMPFVAPLAGDPRSAAAFAREATNPEASVREASAAGRAALDAAQPRAVLRRGLPRTAGTEPWPPGDTMINFAVAPQHAISVGRHAGPADSALAGASVAETLEEVVVPSVVERPQPHAAPPSTIRNATVAGRRVNAAADADKSSPRPGSRVVSTFGGLMATVIGATVAVVVAAAAVLLVRMWLWGTAAGTDFVQAFPGEVHLPDGAPSGFPGWMMWTHWLNAFFMVLIIKTGWTIRTTTRPSATWQSRRGGKKMAVELWIHLSLDVLWIINGAIFVVLLFATGQWIRVVPFSWEFLPNAISAALQYVSLSWPTENGWTNYNALQVFAYFTTIFIAAPLAALSGVRMSPLWPSQLERLSKIYPIEVARKIHFPVMLYFVFFIAAHVFLVFATGALRNLNHMFWGTENDGSWGGFTMFAIGMLVIVGAVAALRPLVIQQLASVFGKVGR